jgi:hypothetical protein
VLKGGGLGGGDRGGDRGGASGFGDDDIGEFDIILVFVFDLAHGETDTDDVLAPLAILERNDPGPPNAVLFESPVAILGGDSCDDGLLLFMLLFVVDGFTLCLLKLDEVVSQLSATFTGVAALAAAPASSSEVQVGTEVPWCFRPSSPKCMSYPLASLDVCNNLREGDGVFERPSFRLDMLLDLLSPPIYIDDYDKCCG